MNNLPARNWAIIYMAIYFLTYSFLSIWRHESFHSTILDLGNFEQILWNTAHGRLFELSTRPWTTTYLGDHFSLILLLPAVIYKLLPATITILIMQTMILAGSGYLVFLIAKKLRFSDGEALGFLAIYLTFPALGFINMFDAHANIFAIPLGFLVIYSYLARKFNWITVAILLLLSVKEDLALVVIGFGLALMFSKRDRWYGLFISALAAAWFVGVINILIPYFGQGNDFHYTSQYAQLGLHGGILSALASPAQLIREFFSLPKIAYFEVLMGSLLFLPILAGRWFLPVLFGLMPIMLNSQTGFLTITYHHAASFLAFIFFTMMIVVRYFGRCLKIRTKRLQLIILTVQGLIISGAIFTNFLPNNYCKSYFCVRKYEKIGIINISKAAKMIPKDASLSVSNNLGAHFDKRKSLYVFPRVEEADYVLVDESTIGQWGNFDEDNKGFEKLKNSPNYEIRYSRDKIWLFRKK